MQKKKNVIHKIYTQMLHTNFNTFFNFIHNFKYFKSVKYFNT